jgi:hypothetical protein
MTILRKWWRLAFVILVLLIAAQAAVSLLARTRRIHNFLIARLEREFGRPVQVAHISVRILPTPQLDADQITVGEDPAFGYEYFLRAERLGARVRWRRLLLGHFEFGTLSLTRPSLTLVRNTAGKWNLEGWLPPAKANAADDRRSDGPQISSVPLNYLQKIKFEEGRINFKSADEKLPFAFTSVSGSVEQIAAGRWQLQLEAQPWRSGVALQSTGTFAVRGDIAGTSARLQPAEISLHWDKVSLADLFRLFTGKDYGVRGEFALDGTAKSASLATEGDPGVAGAPGEWTFAVQARSTQIHRWDLTERPDNPRVNVSMKGRWNARAESAEAEEVKLETPESNLRGTAKFSIVDGPWWNWRVDSAGVQAGDLLAWYRAFHPGVAEQLSAEQFFTGTMTLGGWPVSLADAAFSSAGGVIKGVAPGKSLRIGAVHGGRSRGKFILEPVRVSMEGETQAAAGAKSLARGLKHRTGGELQNAVDISLTHDFEKHTGTLALHGGVERIEDVLTNASSFGQTLNHGWILNGAANAALQWEWKDAPAHGHWSGNVELSGGELLAAGLNLPLRLEEVRLEWKEGTRGAAIERIGGFGASWSGEISETPQAEGLLAPHWSFHLRADHLDAAELDKWIGPRARPSWLERLLPWLSRDVAPGVVPAELLQRLDAAGELRVDELTVEKLKLSQVRADITLRNLQLDVGEADAQWAGGKVRSKVSAKFSPRPEYQVAAELDGVNLAQLTEAGPLNGVASGRVHLTSEGVGREELLQNLSGNGEIHLKKAEFRAWDVSASFSDGLLRAGVSRWASGDGFFAVRDRKIFVHELRLNAGSEQTLVEGSVNFAKEADLGVRSGSAEKRDKRAEVSGRTVKISGPLDEPKVSVEKLALEPASD